MKIDIYKDNISYITDDISYIPTYEANISEENRIKFVTDLAAISRGKLQSNNPQKRYKMLLKEAALGTPSRPLEFLPVIVDVFFNNNAIFIYKKNKRLLYLFRNFVDAQQLLKYSYLEPTDKKNLFRCYTNMRALLNARIKYENIPYATDDVKYYKHFKAIRAKIPMFVFNHIITHTQLSKEARSERVTDLSKCDYWLPRDFGERLNNINAVDTLSFNLLSVNSREMLVKTLLHNSQTKVQNLFKELGYKKEIYQRAMLEFRYKELVMTGWFNNPDSWQHLFLERNAEPDKWKNWTQNETAQFVQAIKKIIGE